MQKVPDTAVPLCTSCGVCCFSEMDGYIRLWAVDRARLSAEQLAKYTVGSSESRQLRFVDGHCSALVIDPTKRTFHCAMYEQRPDACRALSPDSRHCREDRAEKSERPDVAIARLISGRK